MPTMNRQRRTQVGDVVEIAGHSVGEGGRTGEVIAVLGEPGAEHFRVRWEDGHESVFYPGSDATIRPPHGEEQSRESTATFDIMQELAREQLGYELIRHERTETAVDEATAVGVSPDEVAKTIVLVAGDGYVRVVLPASERLDMHKARELLSGTKKVRLASEAELASVYPMFELGAVPPFGGPAGDRVIVDSRLAQRETVVLEAGSHGESVRMKTADLMTLAGADIGDIRMG